MYNKVKTGINLKQVSGIRGTVLVSYNGSIYKTSNRITPAMFREQAEGEITGTEL